MSEVTVQQAIEIALQHQHAGQLPEAEEIYRQILQVYPDQADALHLLGIIAYQAKQLFEAEGLVRRAIAVVPTEATFQMTLGGILLATSRVDEAIDLYREILKSRADIPEVQTHLGIALCVARRHDEAVPAFEESLRLDPGNAYTQGNLGIALSHVNRIEESIAMLRSAVERIPLNTDFHSALATALFRGGRFDEAAACCRTVIQLAPNHGEAHHTLSLVHSAQGKFAEALESARRAVELLPKNVDAQSILADILRRLGRPDDAIAVYREAIQQFREAPEPHSNLGTLLMEQALHDEALLELRQAMSLAPKRASIQSALLYAMSFHPTLDQFTILNEHREFNRRHAESVAPTARGYPNAPEHDRHLRIGYLSTEFCAHGVGMNLVSLLQNHDKALVEVFCYSAGQVTDAVTDHLHKYADQWRDVRNLTDEQIAGRIREDRIDVLIDLHQHAPGNHLLVYARKPAPVQISFGLHSPTTGLTAMDHRLTHAHLEPADAPRPATIENPLAVHGTLWCYLPRGESVAVPSLPMLARSDAGHVSFGCFNEAARINDQTLSMWAKVLQSLPNATLTLVAPESAFRRRTSKFLEFNQIASGRVTFIEPQPGLRHFEAFQKIDISLDTYPNNGHAIALDSLFMGVPVITLMGEAGASPLSRTVYSHLMHVGLQDLAATTAAGFVEAATGLAADVSRLTYLRANLRNRMRASALMNGRVFAQGLEEAYRGAWHRWCDGVR